MRKISIGETIAEKYLLIREIGRGGAGIVFEAEHLYTGRHVALKTVGADADPRLDEEISERLIREARALGRVSHPGIVDIMDAGVAADGIPYVALEMLHGRSLDGVLAARGRLSADDTLAIGIQLVSALDALHRARVIHRDVKPGNIFVVRDGEGTTRTKLMDLGIAASPDFAGRKLTATNEIIGTLEYMSMQRLAGKDSIDERSDVYATGVTLFECLAGDVPFNGSLADIVRQVMPSDAEPLRVNVAGVPSRLAAAIEKAVARHSEDRFATMAEFGAELEAATEGRKISLSLLDNSQARPPSAAAKEIAPAPMARRKFARAPYSTPIRIFGKGAHIDGRTEDVSLGGMLVTSHDSPAPNEEVSVRFALPIEGSMATAKAVVRWVRHAGGPKGQRAIGLEFDELPMQLATSIERYVEIIGRLGY